MVEARDIIANALRGPQPSVKDSEAFIVSDYDAHMVSANIVLAALTAAGWTLAPPGSRVVPEGGVDAAVERMAKAMWDTMTPDNSWDRALDEDYYDGPGRASLRKMAAAALRALAEAKP